jgi:hypothetical protein
MVCRAVLNWAPATETIEQVVLGMGRDAAPFMKQLKAPPEDGEVLVIEVDGKCPPTATEAELAKRRGKRKPKHEKDCVCGCQRHRGKAKRQRRGSKKRRHALVQANAEAVLHLRCIELNGDWETFVTWFHRQAQGRLNKGERGKVLTNQP